MSDIAAFSASVLVAWQRLAAEQQNKFFNDCVDRFARQRLAPKLIALGFSNEAQALERLPPFDAATAHEYERTALAIVSSMQRAEAALKSDHGRFMELHYGGELPALGLLRWARAKAMPQALPFPANIWPDADQRQDTDFESFVVALLVSTAALGAEAAERAALLIDLKMT